MKPTSEEGPDHQQGQPAQRSCWNPLLLEYQLVGPGMVHVQLLDSAQKLCYNCTHCSSAYNFVSVFLYLSHSSVWRSCSLTLRLAPPEVKLLHDWDRRESQDPNLMVILLPLISSLLNVPSAAFSADFLCVNCTKAQPWWLKKVESTF